MTTLIDASSEAPLTTVLARQQNLESIAGSKIDWSALIAKASAEDVLASISHEIAQVSRPTIPTDILSVVSAVNALNSNRNQTALAQSQQLAAALNLLGIHPIALKGLANILWGIYPTVGSRYIADVDILVPVDQVASAFSALRALGYSAEIDNPLECVVGHSYPPLTRPDSLEIDLHRTTGLGICARFLPASELIAQSRPHQLENGAIVRLPSPEHLVIHHIMHSQMHDHYRERIKPSLRTLYDFFLLNRHFGDKLDWHAIENHFRAHGQYATLALYLLEAENTMSVPPPIALHLSNTIRWRRRRRVILQTSPLLRFVDPAYYLLAGIRPRTRRLHEILAQPGGLAYLLQEINTTKVLPPSALRLRTRLTPPADLQKLLPSSFCENQVFLVGWLNHHPTPIQDQPLEDILINTSSKL